MGTVVFIIFALLIISVTIYFTLKNKNHCPNCNSTDIVCTGKKIYEEDPQIAVYGSPRSYHKLEYKCKNCEHLFWEKQKAAIFN